jgi:hypothetical protein
VKPLGQTIFIVCLGESFLRRDKLMSIAASPLMMVRMLVPAMIKNTSCAKLYKRRIHRRRVERIDPRSWL